MRGKHLIPLILLVASGAAMAQQADLDIGKYLSATGSNDWSMRFWQSLLGDFAKSPFTQLGQPTTLLGSMLFWFTGAIAAVSLFWLGYSILTGIVGTAHDGEALGKRINSAWFPIRAVTGLSGVLPIAGGFTLFQALLMWLAALGIGLANFLYAETVKNPNMTQLVGTGALSASPAISRSELENAIKGMMRGHVCMLAHSRLGAEFRELGLPMPAWTDMMARGDATPDGMIIHYGYRANPDACGAVSVRMERSRGDSVTTDIRAPLSYRVASVDYNGIRRSVSDGLAQKLLAGDRIMAQAATMYMSAIDAWFKAGGQDQFVWVDSDVIEKSGLAFRSDVKTLIDSSIKTGGSSITEEAKRNMLSMGWVGAGAFYSTFAEANAALADAVSGAKFSVKLPGQIASGPAEEMDRLEAVFSRVDSMKGETAQDNGDAVAWAMKETCASVPGAGGLIGTATGNCSIGQQVVKALVNGTLGDSGGAGLVNPIIGMKNVGDYVMSVGSVLISAQFTWAVEKAAKLTKWASSAAATAAGAVGLSGVAAAAGNVSQMSAGAETVAAHAVPIGWTLMLVGAFLGIYLPMLPFIAWIGAVLSYAASFLEGFIAMPLHAMSHLHAEGEGLGSNTSRGYLFMLNTFARPPLMVISFFIASALVIGVGTLATQLFIPAVASVQGNSVTGLFSIGAYLFIYFILMSSIVQKSFELVEVIPDQVIGYLGAGDVRSTLGHGVEKAVQAVFGRVGQGGSMAGQASAKSGNALMNARAKKQAEQEARQRRREFDT